MEEIAPRLFSLTILRRFCLIFIFVLPVGFTVSFPMKPVHGSEANHQKDLVLTSFSVDTQYITAGETVHVKANVEHSYEISEFVIGWDREGIGLQKYYYLQEKSKGQFVGEIPIEKNWRIGNYSLGYVSIQDVNGNTFSEIKMVSVFPDACFEVYGTVTDVSAPEIYILSFDQKMVTVGETITLTAVVEDETPIAKFYVQFKLDENAYSDYYYFTKLEDNTYTVQVPIDNNFRSGTHTIDIIRVEDIYGNFQALTRWDSAVNRLGFEVYGTDVETDMPQLISLTVDKEYVRSGEKVTFHAIVEDESKILKMYFKMERNGQEEVKSYDFTSDDNTNFTCEITIDDSWKPGIYMLSILSIEDEHKNDNFMSLLRGNLPTGIFFKLIGDETPEEAEQEAAEPEENEDDLGDEPSAPEENEPAASSGSDEKKPVFWEPDLVECSLSLSWSNA